MAQLNADHPTTDDQQRSGQSIKRQCCRAGEVGYGIQTWNRWNAGPCAHRQNDLADFYRHIVNDQRTVGNACLALDIAYTLIGGQQIDIFFLAQRVDQARQSTRMNSSDYSEYRMTSSA